MFLDVSNTYNASGMAMHVHRRLGSDQRFSLRTMTGHDREERHRRNDGAPRNRSPLGDRRIERRSAAGCGHYIPRVLLTPGTHLLFFEVISIMSSRYGRAIALAVIAVAVLSICASRYIGETPGDYGGIDVVALASGTVRVGTVPKGSSLAQAGLHSGQVVRLARSDLATRAALMKPMEGSRLALITSDGRLVTLLAHAGDKQGYALVLMAVKLAYLLVAGLLAVRRWNERSVRALIAFLVGFGIGLGLPNANPVLSSEFSFAFFDVGAVVLLAFAGAAAAAFSASFSSSPSAAERNLARAAIGSAVLGLIASIASFQAHGAWARAALNLLLALPFLLALATLIVGYALAHAADRSRKLWILMIFGAGMCGPALDLLVSAVAGYNWLIDQFALLTVAIIPVGLAYVILRHRLIDVGFVLNQAAVYAGVSIVIVGVVVIVETLLSNYVTSINHVTSTAVQLSVALGLGFSINAIHKRVERFVDRIFFRARNAAQAALHEFALEAPYITDASPLLERCVEKVRQYAHASRAGVWTSDASRRYMMVAGDFPLPPPVDPNDPAVVAMRARHVVVDLQRVVSTLPGAFAFPMVSGGELLGILVCDAKTDQEAYAPDERASLEDVATSVAHALGTLRIRDLEHEIAALRTVAQT